MKKVIFTADDYGAIKQIDAGVREAVRQRRINSVAVFPNGPNGPNEYWHDSIRQLIKAGDAAKGQGYQLEIGLHLTLTSGWPVDPAGELGTVTGGAPTFHDIADFDFDVTREDALREFRSQHARLADALSAMQRGIPYDQRYRITNLSSHHNIHLFRESIFDAFMLLAQDLRIPVRSFVVVPKARPWAFYMRTRFQTLCDNDREVRRAVRKFYQRLKRRPPPITATVAMPDEFDVSHAGPLPIDEVRYYNVDEKVEDKRKRLLHRLKEQEDDPGVSEFVFHLIEEDTEALDPSVAKGWVEYYPGVDHRLFDSRYLEQCSLLGVPSEDSADTGPHEITLEEIQKRFCSWSEL